MVDALDFRSSPASGMRACIAREMGQFKDEVDSRHCKDLIHVTYAYPDSFIYLPTPWDFTAHQHPFQLHLRHLQLLP